MRLDQYMSEHRPEYSRSVWQKYIKLGYVTVNGDIKADSNQTVGEDDSVVADIPEKIADYSEQTLPIIYEDTNVIVINKPVGILVHSKGALNEEFTVAEFFRSKTTYNLDTDRPGIVHRLDRDTSGVMIGAKNPETARLLSKQFQDRRAKKIYKAVLKGIPKELKANIDLPIARNPKAPSTFRVDAAGKTAHTYYEITAHNDKLALVTLKPTSGRTHQLRVHMAYIGTPILGDVIYGKKADRLYLHAEQLEITIPEGNRQIFTASTPEEFLPSL